MACLAEATAGQRLRRRANRTKNFDGAASTQSRSRDRGLIPFVTTNDAIRLEADTTEPDPGARPIGRARIEPPDISEKGGLKDGQPQRSDSRLFMQLLAFGGCTDAESVASYLNGVAAGGVVVYEDLNDPRGVAVLTLSEDPNVFVSRVRPRLTAGAMKGLTLKPEFSMFGRTYALGYEPDLQEVLIDRPRRTVLNPDWPWAIWYPLRRSGAFAQLSDDQQRVILKEHGQIGMTFGAADYAHDIRLACHGLDRDDNDFVIGLIGKDLFPLSALVQRMRKTQQTALYLDRLGPFFVGRKVVAP
jgi:chlorite dismutase